jgi:hypothetical protein
MLYIQEFVLENAHISVLWGEGGGGGGGGGVDTKL